MRDYFGDPEMKNESPENYLKSEDDIFIRSREEEVRKSVMDAFVECLNSSEALTFKGLVNKYSAKFKRMN